MADEPAPQQTTDEKPAADGQHMHVKIYAPFKVYYDGQAESVTAENDTGPFDILATHHNFMTLLSPCEIIVRDGEKEERVKVSRGIMHVKKDEVIVFLDV
jgi:F0F1-type ATP synthase epsilon subunit